MSEPTFGKWLSIETAPRDGRWIMAGAATDYDVIGGHSWWVGTARFDFPDDDTPELMVASGYYKGPIDATHWMPLPPAPEGDHGA